MNRSCEACLSVPGAEPPCRLSPEQIDSIGDLGVARAILHCIVPRNMQAETDRLTGLTPYGLMLDRLSSRFAHPTRRSEQIVTATGALISPAMTIFIDGNGVGNINKTHGHDFGDSIIRELGGAVRAVSRADDLRARRGGDEFVIIMFGISENDARTKLSNMQESFSHVAELRPPNSDIDIAVGACVAATYIENAISPEHVLAGIALADKALGGWKHGDRSTPPQLQML